MPREGGNRDVRWFDVDPCYVFHPMNAYDDGDSIVLDVVRHPKMFDTNLRGPNEGAPTLDRWTVDLSAGKVIEERLDDRGQEFPRVDERLVGRPHRYGYARRRDGRRRCGQRHAAQARPAPRQHSRAARSARASRSGEFVFDPSSPDAAEDDGVLMGFVYDAARGPQRPDAAGRRDPGHRRPRSTCRSEFPRGFHGNWVPDGQ